MSRPEPQTNESELIRGVTGHTHEYLAAAAMMTGQSRLAREADGSIFVRLRFNRWDDSLSQPMPARSVARVEWYCEHILRWLLFIGSKTRGLISQLSNNTCRR